MNRIQVIAKNVICGAKFGWLWTFDRPWSSWIWEKRKIPSQACSNGQVVCPCQTLSESDEPYRNYCKEIAETFISVTRRKFTLFYKKINLVLVVNILVLLTPLRGRRAGAQNECYWNNSDPVHLIWTKFGMDILLGPRNKAVEEFFSKSKMAVGGQ